MYFSFIARGCYLKATKPSTGLQSKAQRAKGIAQRACPGFQSFIGIDEYNHICSGELRIIWETQSAVLCL